MWRRVRNVHVLHVRANGDSPVPLAMTHAEVTRPKWARENVLHTECGPLSVGGKPGQSTCARTRTRAEVNVKPRLLVNVNMLVQDIQDMFFFPSHVSNMFPSKCTHDAIAY